MAKFYVNFTYGNEEYELTLPCPDLEEYFLFMGLPSEQIGFYQEMKINRLECDEFDFSYDGTLDLVEFNRLLMELNYLSAGTIYLVGLLTKYNGNTFEAFKESLKTYNQYDYFDIELGDRLLGEYILTDIFGTNIASSAIGEAVYCDDIANEALYQGMVFEVGASYLIRKNDLLQSARKRGASV
ncbi:MAG: hypothetical protein E7406_08830 [Ruminococcaceae bacterium]|nr:hypothetical protein [Oscillospiraceae bacterium]